jgi:protoheme IX farnesyltransferase
MKRTAKRPLPLGRMPRANARDFGVALSVASVLLMGLAVNAISAVILAISILYYAVVYTIWLKPRTPQNIVIGGGAGAFPPLIGWVAVTGHITWMPVLLFAIIFMWTPPHFWALALFVQSDYAKAGVPMMPVVKGQASTRRQIFAYALVLFVVSLAPWWLGGTGAIYGVAALILSGLFVALCLPVAIRRSSEGDRMKPEKRLFSYSVLYLFALFTALVADRLILGQGLAA